MFKKLKDKLAEEVKSSPQRIQLFAQAAQAAVTSASSSISDITNSDLFSIGDNDAQQSRQTRPQSSPTTQQTMFQDVSLMHSPNESTDSSHEIVDGQRQRRLSNSSFASDVSFRLPSYETPSMYHLQSDMEVSASEADDRGFSGGPATLDRVTKEQLYAAYKRTQERYKKYRTQYGDLARHYKLLERENAKARSVLVETQDKALRRISELKEQCTLEQSAKAHLEKALRVEIEERNMKIETLNTKVHLIQSNMSTDVDTASDNSSKPNETENEVQLINLDNESTAKPLNEDTGTDVATLSNKIEKMEQLLNKYKESLKTSKEKNSQITIDLKIISKELENKNKQIQELNTYEGQLKEAKSKIQELNSLNEELQNQINTFDFTKTRELSTLEVDLQKANEEIAELRGIIEAFKKREEEYAISLAENKLSIHKELESKETEIKSLKDSLSASKKEIQSLQISLDDYKKIVSVLEEEKLNNDCRELRSKISEMDTNMQELSKKTQYLEQVKTKADEEYKCLQLQLKQETAEKLAMIDRNVYLESKNSQLVEENTKKSTRISNLESELQQLNSNKDLEKELLLKETEKSQILADMMSWKEKCGKLEFEIQEEREELAKLQTEIDKLLNNHELIQAQNSEFRSKIVDLTTEYSRQQENIIQYKSSLIPSIQSTLTELRELREIVSVTSNETKRTLESNKQSLLSETEGINNVLRNSVQKLLKDIQTMKAQHDNLKLDYNKLQTEIEATTTRKSEESCEISTLQNELKNLKTILEVKETEKLDLNDKFEKLDSEYRCAADKNTSLISENNALTNKLKELEEFVQHLHVTFETERSDHVAATEKLHKCVLDNQHLNNTIQTLQTRNAMLDMEIEQLKQHHSDTLDQMTRNHEGLLRMKEEELEKMSMQDNQASSMIEQLSELQSEKDELNSQLQILENKNVGQVTEIKDLNIELKMATEKVKELNIEIFDKASVIEKLEQNQTSLENEVGQYVASRDSVTELENEKQELTEKLKSSEVKIKLLNEELHELKKQCKSTDNKMKEINSLFINKSKECDTSQVKSSELDEKNRTLAQENLLLQTKVSDFAYNIKKLESEIDEIKVSHSEIEIEKDRLNRIIEELETKQNEHNDILKIDKECQTEKNSAKKETCEDVSAVLENKWVVEHKQTAMSSTVSLNLNKESIEDMHEQYSTLRINYDTIKDENRRLQSDIEGLQSYMTKISKENSVLNDKLRELIATSEHSADNGQLSIDDKELRNEIQRGKEKINDLQRENSLLIEENYELKDQLQSQNYSKPTETQTVSNKEKDVNILKLKYNDLLDTTSQLETQNIELDQINKSVSGNMKQLQEKNERLKLSNEKLERRLDEALVSLRHLHSLQENTELEYLRNILYEYLTGSGTHSVTLAKVLAAIVKFDDMQTQLVLQKEKERQGFLRQLGII